MSEKIHLYDQERSRREGYDPTYTLCGLYAAEHVVTWAFSGISVQVECKRCEMARIKCQKESVVSKTKDYEKVQK